VQGAEILLTAARKALGKPAPGVFAQEFAAFQIQLADDLLEAAEVILSP